VSILEKIHHFLIKHHKTLSLAESCTGGHLAALFTQMPDASRYFLGSLVTYSNHFKEKLLHVSQKTLFESGPVSRETANEMLLGLMKFSEADYGIALTGIAGPTGGSKEHPVGTVFIALGVKGQKPHVVECQFTGSRDAIMRQACERAIVELDLLFQ